MGDRDLNEEQKPESTTAMREESAKGEAHSIHLSERIQAALQSTKDWAKRIRDSGQRPPSSASDHFKRLSAVLAAIVIDSIFVALWTIVEYWMGKLFEQFPPSLEFIILHKVFEYSTLTIVVLIIINDLARVLIRVFALSRGSGEDPETEVSVGDD